MGGPARLHGNFVANGESALQHSASAPHFWRASLHSAPRAGAAAAAPLKLKNARRRHRNTLRLTAFTTAMAGAFAYAALTHRGANPRQAQPAVEEADRLAEMAGLGVRQVFLTGHRMAADKDIFDALDLTNARSLLRFDSRAARDRIERLPWVKSAAITRIFPDTISIEIAERQPFAVWHRSGRALLIDDTGRVLAAAPPSVRAELPHVSGEGAAHKAAEILAAVNRHPELATRLQEAIRVADRRWTLRLTDGPEIHLPAERQAEALQLLMSKRAELSLLNGSRHAAVDLRPANRIILRPKREQEKETASGHNAQPSG